jgi:phosphatidylserine decarboxylase
MLFVINKQPKIPLVKPGQILSPSSGYIGDIHYHKNGQTTIMFILSFFDNHIQYIPYNGKIIKNEYVQSKYLKPKRVFILDPRLFPNFEESIRDNEQYQTTLSTDIGNMYITRIAGIVAPRVHSFINNQEMVKQGEVMGVIIFSSIVLLTLPKNVKLNIKKGDTANAGETIIAHLLA